MNNNKQLIRFLWIIHFIPILGLTTVFSLIEKGEIDRNHNALKLIASAIYHGIIITILILLPFLN